MTNPLQVPELLQLILSAVDTKSLHSCACVSHLWFRHAATAAQNRLQTNQQLWMKEVNPQAAGFNFSTTPLEKLAVKGEEQELWEVWRWWLRFHKDLLCFIDGKAAMQFTYVSTSIFLIFRGIEKPFFNTPTGQDCFPVKNSPTILTMNWQMFWWEDFDELLRSCELFEGIFGYSGSLNPFTRDDIAQIISINGAWYLYTYDERALLVVMLLTDGRFAFLCEGSYVGTVHSRVSINYKIIFASSLQMLLFFALGDAQRGILGIDIGAAGCTQPSTKQRYSLMAKKVKESPRWANDTTPESTDPMEKYLTFPQFRIASLLMKLEFASQECIENNQPSPEEYHADQLPSITCEETLLLWSPLWEEDEDEEECKKHDDKYRQEWAHVWNGCSGFHRFLAWMNNEKEGREPLGDGEGEKEDGAEAQGEAMEM